MELPYPFSHHRESQIGFHLPGDDLIFSIDPIEDRGRTFHEEVLALRYIKFSTNDIQWKCNAGTACLCGAPTDKEFMKRYLPRRGHPDSGIPVI